MSRALRRAGVGASDVTFVSAHATATPHGDLAEFKALQTALGSSLPGVCVTAVKSALGHLIGASGAVATALAIMSLHDGAVPPTLNVDHLDPQIELNVVRNSPGYSAEAALRSSIPSGSVATMWPLWRLPREEGRRRRRPGPVPGGAAQASLAARDRLAARRGLLHGLSGSLSQVTDDGASAYLPSSAPSTQVAVL